MKLWRVNYETSDVTHVECPSRDWPARDADGKTIFLNTHFEDEEEAWEQVKREIYADLQLKAGALEVARRRVRELEIETADAAIKWHNLQNKLTQSG